MFKNKFAIPSLLLIIIVLISLVGVLTFQTLNSTNSKKEILDRVDKLASMEIDLPSVNQGNVYILQNPDSLSKIQLSLERLEKSSNTAKRVFDESKNNNLDKYSKNYVELFDTNFGKFKSDKKEFDCLYQAYNEYSSQGMMYGMRSNGVDNTYTVLKTKIEDAKKCGLKIEEKKVEEVLENYKTMTDLSNTMQNQNLAYDKFTQPTPTQMEAQNQQGLKFGEASSKFSNSMFEFVNSKYAPLVEYSRFIKTSQDNF